jgi:GT2 family glycosyltransferase
MQIEQFGETGSVMAPQPAQLDVSVLIVSFNTVEVLRKCLEHLKGGFEGLRAEVIVVDNNSLDGSGQMVASNFPEVRLILSSNNLGFAAANNLAFQAARGQYLVLLNSDAFAAMDAIPRAFAHMQSDSSIGAGGARLIGTDGSWQPSVRSFPSVLNGILTFTGLPDRYPKSRFFGRVDYTWADPSTPTDGDWVPGAFMIIRQDAIENIGGFDESFFLYFEEVDLSRRLRDAGYRIRYYPDVVVTHLGGESSKSHRELELSSAGKQLILWRLRSEFLYYRKHHGEVAVLAMWSERTWHYLRLVRNIFRGRPGWLRLPEIRVMIALIDRAWSETCGGRISPPRPW